MWSLMSTCSTPNSRGWVHVPVSWASWSPRWALGAARPSLALLGDEDAQFVPDEISPREHLTTAEKWAFLEQSGRLQVTVKVTPTQRPCDPCTGKSLEIKSPQVSQRVLH